MLCNFVIDTIIVHMPPVSNTASHFTMKNTIHWCLSMGLCLAALQAARALLQTIGKLQTFSLKMCSVLSA